MVTNTDLTIDMITQEALIVLEQEVVFGNRVLREFDGEWGRSGRKIGDTLRVRKPARFQTNTGPALQPQNFTETYTPIAVQTQRQVGLEFTSKELSLAIDNFRDRVIKPQMAQLASDMDSDGITTATSGFTITNSGYVTANYAGQYAGFQGLVSANGYYANGVPQPWSGISLGAQATGNNYQATVPFFQAMAVLDSIPTPSEERYCVLSPQAAALTAASMLNIFNQPIVGDIYEKGRLGELAEATFYKSGNIQQFLSGNWTNSGAATNVASAVVSGASSITVQGIGNNANVNSGDQFVVSGCYAVNQLNRTSTGYLEVFTVNGAAQANATGVVTLSVYPPIANSGQYQTTTTLPAVGNQVTFLGTSNTATFSNIMYEKNAIAMCVAALEEDLPGARVSVMSDEENGMSVRFVQQYQSTIDSNVNRIDVLYGWGVVRPELGLRIQA